MPPDVVDQTARADLLYLTRQGLLDKQVRGRSFVFFPPEGLNERVKTIANRPR
jgi:hypothetical protein